MLPGECFVRGVYCVNRYDNMWSERLLLGWSRVQEKLSVHIRPYFAVQRVRPNLQSIDAAAVRSPETGSINWPAIDKNDPTIGANERSNGAICALVVKAKSTSNQNTN